MIQFQRDGLTLGVEQIQREMHGSARDAGVDLTVADAIVAGALAGDAADQESLFDFTGAECVDLGPAPCH